jgi:hypothetical protein
VHRELYPVLRLGSSDAVRSKSRDYENCWTFVRIRVLVYFGDRDRFLDAKKRSKYRCAIFRHS